jgi:hypothetical protein
VTPKARAPRGRGQNRRAIARPRSSTRAGRLAKTRARPRHAGGRPPLLIPAVVVARAAELAARGCSFSTVVRMLEKEGNGTWPRKTLLRRVRSTSSSATPAPGQNQQLGAGGRRELEQLEGLAKTTLARGGSWYAIPAAAAAEWRRLEAVKARAKLDSPAYHAAVAAMHASPSNPLRFGAVNKGKGPCGCYSCAVAKRRAA